MDTEKKPSKGATIADDNTGNTAHYDNTGHITREDERDRHDSTTDWNAEDSRTGRHK